MYEVESGVIRAAFGSVTQGRSVAGRDPRSPYRAV